ncbi:hypothetical protein GCM10027605_74550 [Micromonospora zhanjiangensis]
MDHDESDQQGDAEDRGERDQIPPPRTPRRRRGRIRTEETHDPTLREEHGTGLRCVTAAGPDKCHGRKVMAGPGTPGGGTTEWSV